MAAEDIMAAPGVEVLAVAVVEVLAVAAVAAVAEEGQVEVFSF